MSATRDSADTNLLRALRNTNIAVLYQGRDLVYQWAENVPEPWTSSSPVGGTDADLFPKPEVARIEYAKRDVLDGGERARLEVGFPDPRGTRWYDVWFDADRVDGVGPVVGLLTTAVEVTEQKQREQTLRLLLREVSHRSKNLLAIIQSIAAQTGRYSGSIGDFMTRFRGRLQSLSSSQDLVTSSNWRGADLHELIHGQVGRYCADADRNIRLAGCNPYLNPNAALHVGLALHELAVNSVSYGALSSPEGAVEISATTLHPLDRPGEILFVWREQIPVGRATRFDDRRFGSVALERVVPASLNSTARLSVEDGTLTYSLVLPADSFIAD